MTGRTRGRRPGGPDRPDTRGAIVAAARTRFGDAGYAGTTLRDVAAAAGVDARLVLHYFGSKRGLFEAAVELSMDPALVVRSVLGFDPDDPAAVATRPAPPAPLELGRRAATVMVSLLDDPQRRLVFIGLLRAAVTDEEAAAVIRDILATRILAPLSRGIGASRPELRAAFAMAQVVGLAIGRHVVGVPPLAAATREELITALTPALAHYLAGDWLPD